MTSECWSAGSKIVDTISFLGVNRASGAWVFSSGEGCGEAASVSRLGLWSSPGEKIVVKAGMKEHMNFNKSPC